MKNIVQRISPRLPHTLQSLCETTVTKIIRNLKGLNWLDHRPRKTKDSRGFNAILILVSQHSCKICKILRFRYYQRGLLSFSALWKFPLAPPRSPPVIWIRWLFTANAKWSVNAKHLIGTLLLSKNIKTGNIVIERKYGVIN